MESKAATIDDYLIGVREPQRAALDELRKTILSIVPNAQEVISYGIPAFRVQDGIFAGFCATVKGCSYFPFSGTTLTTLAEELRGYSQTKSALHFTPDKPIPKTLVRKLVKARMAEVTKAGARSTSTGRKAKKERPRMRRKSR
jgi:uncharacterized protein YdhG (YjbR/CyaY superfamily)